MNFAASSLSKPRRLSRRPPANGGACGREVDDECQSAFALAGFGETAVARFATKQLGWPAEP
jgi:hypothetical protein